MSNGVKKSKTPQKNSMVEIAFIMNAALEKGGKILEEIIEGNSIFEFAIHKDEMSIKLEGNQVGKETGDRYLNGEKISIKGKTEKPKVDRKSKANEDNDLTH